MEVQVLLSAPRRCGRHIVRSDFFCKSRFSLILSQLLSESNPLSLGFDSVFYSDWGTLFCQCFPRRCGRHIVRSDFFAKVASHSFCRSSFPNRTRYRWASIRFFYSENKRRLSFTPALLLCAKGHARLACSVASAPAAARCRCHLRSQGHFKIFRRCLFCYLLTCYCGLRILRGGVFFSKRRRSFF